MKKFIAVFILLFSLILTACNLLFPENLEFIVIYKDEWDLIEDFTDHTARPYLLNENINKTNITDPVQRQAYDNNLQALHNTRQIQAAIDHYMAQGYKNIRLEQGEYFIGGRLEPIVWNSGTQNWRNPEMIRIQPKHSGLNFDLGGSTLKLEPHDRMESRIISISSSREPTRDIKIFNGTLIGDRVNHRYEDTKDGSQLSHEWGSGIDIWGDVHNVELYNLTIKEVTGDCIGANGFNITIRDCDISRGRRNGIVSVYADGLTIYNNRIHCIYNAGVAWDCTNPATGGCLYCPDGGHPDSQREYFGSGIGAEACIAFEHTSNPYFDRQMNIKIYNNWLDGQKPRYQTYVSNSSNRTYYMDNAINFHWATYAVWIYNNDIVGDFEWSCGGSNTLIENNRFLTRGYKGYSISKGLVASGSILETGRSAANYVVIRNNYFRNYNVIVGGASGGVSDSQPDWRHDYAIVDNVFVYDEPRIFSNGGTSADSYYTGICVSVNNTVVMGNVFDVRYTPHIGTPTDPRFNFEGATTKPLACAIYIDVVDRNWSNRIPDNLKVDLYIAANTYLGPIWRQKYYVLNNNAGIEASTQYEMPASAGIPANYSETNNYTLTYDMYQSILRKVRSVGNIWGRTR